MRFGGFGAVSVLALCLGQTVPVQAQDAFMQACLMTTPQKMCECISSKLPADKRAAVDRNDPSTWTGASRNAPCPCGSGRKYKYCHGKIGASPTA